MSSLVPRIKSPGTSFTVGPLLHCPKQMNRSNAMSMRRSWMPASMAFGDGHTAALGARRLVGLETAVDADQDFVRAGVHMFYLSTAARGTELIAMLGEYTGILTDWRLQKARPYLAIFHNISILFIIFNKSET